MNNSKVKLLLLTTLLLLALLTPTKAQSPEWHDVTVTVYNATSSQTDSTPLITADNSRIDTLKLRQGNLRWIAVSRDLLKKFPFGTMVYIWISEGHPKNGSYFVHDSMGPRAINSIDILTYNERHGKWKAKIQKNP